MLWIVAIALIAILALSLLGFAVHLILSPWVLVPVIVILAWIKLRPRRTRP